MTRDASHSTSDVVTVFARQGIAISTIARALALPPSRVKGMCERAKARDELQMLPPATPEDRKGALLAEVTNLRMQLDDALARERDLRDDHSDQFEMFYGVGGLTRSEAMVVSALVHHPMCTKSSLLFSMYGDGEHPEPKIVDVFVCKVRAKLKSLDVTIETLWGIGYSMPRAGADKLRALAAADHAAHGWIDAPALVPTHAEMVA
jgi:hypothetical protein